VPIATTDNAAAPIAPKNVFWLTCFNNLKVILTSLLVLLFSQT
jgi:hypothetical protein